MFGFRKLFCWVSRRPANHREQQHHGSSNEHGGKRRKRRRVRRYIHAKAGSLAPVRVPAGSDVDGGQGMSPLSDGRISTAFTDSEYHDALEHNEDGSFTSFSSMDGSHPASSPAGSYGRQESAPRGASAPQPSVFERLAAWWEARQAGQDEAADGDAAAPGGGASEAATPRSPPSQPRGSPLGSPPSPSVPPDEILEPADDGKVGCMAIFAPSGSSSASRRFVRLTKPPAGSSFRAGSGDSAPPSPKRSAVAKWLSQLSPLSPGTPRTGSPLPGRLLSSSRRRQKSVEEAEEVAAAAWQPAEGTSFQVRSHNYMRSKVKEPSGPCIYRLIGVDVYTFDFKIYHIAQHVTLPPAPVLGPGAAALPPDQALPPLLIINMQLPTYAPSLFGCNDGHGHSLVYYFALPEGWEPSQMDNQAALGLVQRFMHNKREADGTPTRDRFKLIPRIVNVAEWAEKGPLSGYEHRLLMNYNDKPLLTRPQQRFYTGPNYLEIDMDVHNYAFIARKAFHGFIHRLAPVVFENAFVVQGNRSEELPEQVLAAARVYRLDFNKARPFPAKSLGELGNGTGPAHDGEAARQR